MWVKFKTDQIQDSLASHKSEITIRKTVLHLCLSLFSRLLLGQKILVIGNGLTHMQSPQLRQ